MDDAVGMKIFQPGKNLTGERPGDLVFKLAMFSQAGCDRSTRNVFKEAKQKKCKSASPNPFGKCLHAQEIGSPFESQVLHDVGMVEVFQCLTFKLQSLNDADLTLIVPISISPWDFDLLYSNHFASRRVQSQVYATIRPFAN